MQFGVLTFVTDEGIGPAELGAALEHRGFESLFLADTPIFPSTRRAPTRAVAQFRRSITAPWIPLWRWRPRQLPPSHWC